MGGPSEYKIKTIQKSVTNIIEGSEKLMAGSFKKKLISDKNNEILENMLTEIFKEEPDIQDKTLIDEAKNAMRMQLGNTLEAYKNDDILVRKLLSMITQSIYQYYKEPLKIIEDYRNINAPSEIKASIAATHHVEQVLQEVELTHINKETVFKKICEAINPNLNNNNYKSELDVIMSQNIRSALSILIDGGMDKKEFQELLNNSIEQYYTQPQQMIQNFKDVMYEDINNSFETAKEAARNGDQDGIQEFVSAIDEKKESFEGELLQIFEAYTKAQLSEIQTLIDRHQTQNLQPSINAPTNSIELQSSINIIPAYNDKNIPTPAPDLQVLTVDNKIASAQQSFDDLVKYFAQTGMIKSKTYNNVNKVENAFFDRMDTFTPDVDNSFKEQLRSAIRIIIKKTLELFRSENNEMEAEDLTNIMDDTAKQYLDNPKELLDNLQEMSKIESFNQQQQTADEQMDIQQSVLGLIEKYKNDGSLQETSKHEAIVNAICGTLTLDPDIDNNLKDELKESMHATISMMLDLYQKNDLEENINTLILKNITRYYKEPREFLEDFQDMMLTIKIDQAFEQAKANMLKGDKNAVLEFVDNMETIKDSLTEKRLEAFKPYIDDQLSEIQTLIDRHQTQNLQPSINAPTNSIELQSSINIIPAYNDKNIPTPTPDLQVLTVDNYTTLHF